MPSAARAQARDTVVKRDTLARHDSLTRLDTLIKRDTGVRRDTIPPGDTLARRDTAAKRDTTPHIPLPADTVKPDTVKAPITHAEMPQTADPTGSYHLDRDQIFATGAQSVADLLDRLPGITELHVGWLSTPTTAAYLGDPRRVRVFLDGLEYDSYNPHGGAGLDLAHLPLWPIQGITVERSASEVRVYLDTWTVDRTTPYTRTDITTGDLQTNLYRGFFGRRFAHGELLQFGVEQYGTLPTRDGGTSDQLSLMGRLGWAHGPFSVDAFMLQVRSHQGLLIDSYTADSINSLDATRRDAYVRLGYGTPDHGPWLQALAANTRYSYAGGAMGSSSITSSTDTTTTPSDTVASGSQYVLAGGLTKWGLHLSGTARYFGNFDRGVSPADSAAYAAVLDTASDSTKATLKPPKDRHGLFVPSARASFDWWRFAFSAYAEGKGTDSVSHREVSAVFTPFSFLRIMGAVGTARDARMPDSLLSPSYRRLEAGLRIHDFWIGGGTLMRGAVALAAPTLVNDSLTAVREPSATAAFVTVQGRVWKGIHADAFALRWNDSTGFYRPRFQTHEQLYISTSLLDRFPNNSFHFYLSLSHEYRSATFFPVGNGGIERLPGYRTVGAALEIRIERAVLSYRLTNALGEKYYQVPGFFMPRQTSIYGVRWYFWN